VERVTRSTALVRHEAGTEKCSSKLQIFSAAYRIRSMQRE
jgi:hypothetical protein